MKTLLESDSLKYVNPFVHDELYTRIQQKGIQYVVNQVHSHELRLIADSSDPRIAMHHKALDSVANILGNMHRAVLTGGFGVEATILSRYPETVPQFQREHYDVNLGIAHSQFPEIVQRASLVQYYPFARLAMWHLIDKTGQKVGKKDIYYPLTWEDVTTIGASKRSRRVFGLRRKDRHIRLIHIPNNTGEIYPHESLTDYVELYLHQYIGGQLKSNQDVQISCPLYFSGETFTTRSGQKLKVVNPRYLLALKEKKAKSRIEIFP